MLVTVALEGAAGQSFQPTHKLTTWYTDRTPIDLEIVGSSSRLPDMHRLEPKRVLRFRLERAYVHTLLAKDKPGFEIVHLGFDMESGLPDSLVTAVSQSGRFHEDIPGVPRVRLSDKARRTQLIVIRSDASSAGLQLLSDRWRQCLGESLDGDLQSYQQQTSGACRRPAFPDATYFLASYDPKVLLRIRCRGPRHRGTGCSVEFPYDGFSAKLSFHRDHLPQWREMIERASKFLDSQRYH